VLDLTSHLAVLQHWQQNIAKLLFTRPIPAGPSWTARVGFKAAQAEHGGIEHFEDLVRYCRCCAPSTI
jgi:hypothetical protein